MRQTQERDRSGRRRVTMDKQDHEEIKYVQNPPLGKFGEPEQAGSSPTEAVVIGARPDPATAFKKPFNVTVRPWRDDPPVVLLTLHPNGSIKFGDPVDGRTLWVAMQGDNTTAA